MYVRRNFFYLFLPIIIIYLWLVKWTKILAEKLVVSWPCVYSCQWWHWWQRPHSFLITSSVRWRWFWKHVSWVFNVSLTVLKIRCKHWNWPQTFIEGHCIYQWRCHIRWTCSSCDMLSYNWWYTGICSLVDILVISSIQRIPSMGILVWSASDFDKWVEPNWLPIGQQSWPWPFLRGDAQTWVSRPKGLLGRVENGSWHRIISDRECISALNVITPITPLFIQWTDPLGSVIISELWAGRWVYCECQGWFECV